MQKAEGTTEQLISSARDFLGDKSPGWKWLRGVRGCKDDEKDAPDLPENAELRPHQDACVLATLAHWGSGQEVKVHPKSQSKSVVAKVVLPTATGKSWVIAVLAVVMAKKKDRVLILTPNEEIRAGLLSKLQRFASKRKVMDDGVGDGDDSLKIVVLVARGAGDGEKKRHKTLRVNFDVVQELHSDAFKEANVVVSNYQTMTNNHGERIFGDGISPFKVILVDEAHHAGAHSYRMLFEECKPKFLCNLTATPIDSKDNNICGTRVPEFKYTLDWAESRNLVKKRKLAILSQETETGKQDGWVVSAIETEDESNESNTYEFHEGKHEAIARKTVEECIRLRKVSGQPHVALAKAFNIKEANKLEEIYNAVTYDDPLIGETDYAVVVNSESAKGVRDKKLKLLEEGKYMVCIVVGMLGEGYDNQLISVIAWHCRTNKATRLYQFLGRGLRRLQHEYLEEKKLLGVCGKEDKRDGDLEDFDGPKWPPGRPDEIEIKEVTQKDLDEREQECVMVVSHEDYCEMRPLYEAIEGDMEGKREAIESDSSYEEERPTALEEKRKRKSDAAARDGSERAKRQKLSDDEKFRRKRDARIERQKYAAKRITAGHEADRLFNDNARQSGILRLEQNFEKWQKDGNGQKDANKWRNDPAIDKEDKKLLDGLENPIKQGDWCCHLYRCAVKDLAEGGSEVDRDEALKRVDFRWRRARRNSPVLKALLDEATPKDKIPKDEPLFSGTVKFKKS